MDTKRPLDERVKTAFEKAAENGYHFEGWTAEQIAIDMTSYDADLEDEKLEDVESAVTRFQAKIAEDIQKLRNSDA